MAALKPAGIRSHKSTPDPGLQPERTVLAWTRTSMAVGAAAIAVLRAASASSETTTLVLAFTLIVGAAVMGGIGWHRTKHLGGDATPTAAAPVSMLLASCATLCICLAGLALCLWGPG